MRPVPALTLACLVGLAAPAAAPAAEFPQQLASQKLMMEMQGFEKDTVMQDITYRDAVRLDSYDAIRAQAFDEARSADAAGDIATLDALDARRLRSLSDFDLGGDWQCRTIKLGGPDPLVIYDWFRCRIADGPAGWRLEKLSGSQRTAGTFYTIDDKRLIYLGAYHVAGDPAPAYGAARASDQVGYVLRDGERSWRIEFPAPARESVFDILEFRRPQ